LKMRKEIDTIVFDLGAVLIDWNPEYLYRKIIADETERLWFFNNICTADWNEEQDAGRPLQVATDELVNKYPEFEDNIRAYYDRWEEMLNGPIEETLELFKLLKNQNRFKFYALTNWSAETFPIALRKYEFLHWFDGRLVSGEEKTRKPFKGFYQTLIEKFSITPEKALFIDDNLRNIPPASDLGMNTIHFTNAGNLARHLKDLSLI
jgi:2-haloacid dehalogenase